MMNDKQALGTGRGRSGEREKRRSGETIKNIKVVILSEGLRSDAGAKLQRSVAGRSRRIPSIARRSKSDLSHILKISIGEQCYPLYFSCMRDHNYYVYILTNKNKKVLYNFRTKQFFGREVNHPGFAGDSYLYWATKNAGKNIKQYFEEVVKRRANNKFLK